MAPEQPKQSLMGQLPDRLDRHEDGVHPAVQCGILIT
jgi:hypothetical protein